MRIATPEILADWLLLDPEAAAFMRERLPEFRKGLVTDNPGKGDTILLLPLGIDLDTFLDIHYKTCAILEFRPSVQEGVLRTVSMTDEEWRARIALERLR